MLTNVNRVFEDSRNSHEYTERRAERWLGDPGHCQTCEGEYNTSLSADTSTAFMASI